MKKIKHYILIACGAFLFGLTISVSSNHGAICAICFTPGQNCTQKIIETIDNAKSKILVQSYSFTSMPIADALIRAHKRGIKVACIFDNSQQNNILISKLAQYFPVYIDKPLGIAHNKVMIIDDQIVLTGSFNFTQAAQYRNVENSVHIESKTIALQYKKQWNDRLKLSKKFVPTIDVQTQTE